MKKRSKKKVMKMTIFISHWEEMNFHSFIDFPLYVG